MFACRALQLYTLTVCLTGYSSDYLTRFRGPLSPHRFGKTTTKPPMPGALTGDSIRQAHTPSIAFRHLPPKERCRKPVLGVCSLCTKWLLFCQRYTFRRLKCFLSLEILYSLQQFMRLLFIYICEYPD